MDIKCLQTFVRMVPNGVQFQKSSMFWDLYLAIKRNHLLVCYQEFIEKFKSSHLVSGTRMKFFSEFRKEPEITKTECWQER